MSKEPTPHTMFFATFKSGIKDGNYIEAHSTSLYDELMSAKEFYYWIQERKSEFEKRNNITDSIITNCKMIKDNE